MNRLVTLIIALVLAPIPFVFGTPGAVWVSTPFQGPDDRIAAMLASLHWRFGTMMRLTNPDGSHGPRGFACVQNNGCARKPQVRIQPMLVTGALTAPARMSQGTRRRAGPFRRVALIAVALVLAMLPFAALRAAAPATAAAFIENLSETVSEQIVAPDIGRQERERRFRAVLAENLNIELIGRFVLGRYWRTAGDEERSVFLKVFLETMAHRFMPLLTEYSGETFRVGEVRPNPTNPALLTVTSQVIRPKAEPVHVEWRVRRTGDRYEVVDVVAEGVSMAITLRSEYGSFIQRHGGGAGALIQSLREKLQADAVAASSARPVVLQ